MDLKDFVAETLTQIAEGAAQASDKAAATGAIVNPKRWGGQHEGYHDGAKIISVEFTVALSVSDGSSTKGGIGVVAGIFAVGSQGQSSEARASTTHVKFSVPMALPLSKDG